MTLKDQYAKLSTGWSNYPVESGRAAVWSLVARLAVIPWSLVAHTNSRIKKSEVVAAAEQDVKLLADRLEAIW